MDTAHSIMFVVLGRQSLVLVYAIVGVMKIAAIASAAEESVKGVPESVKEVARIAREVAEIASRTEKEKMTQSILQKVHNVPAPEA
jgi:diacylglycerol kinase